MSQVCGGCVLVAAAEENPVLLWKPLFSAGRELEAVFEMADRQRAPPFQGIRPENLRRGVKADA